MSQTSEAAAWPTLQKQQFMNLFTYRKSGAAVKTPVWFAQRGERLYVFTGADAGKVKRIRNNPRVLVGPSDRAGNPLGPTAEAVARVLPPEEHAAAKAALDDKYGLMKLLFDVMGTLRGMQRAYIEITPAGQ